MLRFVVFLACIAVALGGAIDGRILGGYPASLGQFPYQISMRSVAQGSHFCGGTIISSRVLVTAAHCIYGQSASDMFIVVGTTTLNQGGQAYRLQSAVYHPGYSQQTMFNDIAILKTDTDIQFNAYVQPAPLQQGEIAPGTPLVLSGWGLTSYPGNIPNNLQYVSLTAIDLNTCAQLVQSFAQVSQGQICTYTRVGQGACQGDSGGPLVSNGALTGVVSFGMPCARGYPDVFTKVAAYIPWIQQTARNTFNVEV